MLKNEDYLLPLINITREYIIDHRIDELVRLFNSDFLTENFKVRKIHTKELFYAIKTYVDPTNMFQRFY